MEIKVKYPTPENFKKFGTLIVPPFKNPPAVSSEIFNYYHDVADISSLGNEGCVGYLEIKRDFSREFVLEKMERHKNTLEAFIPISGVGIFCLAPATPNKSSPDLDSIEAFWVDGTASFFLNEGVWHWLPYPITSDIRFILLLKKPTVEKDIEIVDLSEKVRIVLVK
ncbi:MAG: ureidoglycolate lyase [Dictyoglomaceae bacterium]|jgi:ureidoglycolate hydrolase